MNQILIVALAASLTACASAPSRIKPIANAGPCTEADKTKLASLYKAQNSAAVADTLGVLAVGVPVASLGGGDQEAEIAVLKGRCGEPPKK